MQPTFAQRAFDLNSTVLDLGFHNLTVSPDGRAILTFQRLGGSFGILAPRISNIIVNEAAGEAIIYGIFGQDPRTGSDSGGSVEIGGGPASIDSWNANAIKVTLKPSGSDAAGDVVVTVRGHKSNVARFCRWHQFILCRSNCGIAGTLTGF